MKIIDPPIPLVHCPWCGHAPVIEQHGKDNPLIGCDNDACAVNPILRVESMQSLLDACEKWNRRHP